MKGALTLMLALVLIPNAFGDKDLSGFYENESGFVLHLTNDSLYFIIDQTGSIAYANDTLAKCRYNRIDNNLLELSTATPDELVIPTMQIIQDSVVSDTKGIEVIFHIPNQYDLDIEILTDKYKTVYLDYSNRNNTVILDEQTRKFLCSIQLKRNPLPHDSYGHFYGIITYGIPEVQIDENKNRITIDLPAIDDSFFERYSLRKDYARVIGDTIFWKNDFYIKCKQVKKCHHYKRGKL